MHKAVRSKFILMERLYQIESQCDINWNERIPSNMNDKFYDSFINQFNYLTSFDDLNANELSWVLWISTKIYEKIIHNEYYFENSKGRPPFVDNEEEKVLLEKMIKRQMSGDCMSPKEELTCQKKKKKKK